MATLQEVNSLTEAGVSEFRIQSYDGWKLLVVGSFDLCYYHNVELTFTDVAYLNLPTTFYWATFEDIGRCPCCERRRIAIRSEDQTWEIIAHNVEAFIGKVYYYDRGTQLKPGERIAPWVAQRDRNPSAQCTQPRE